MTSGTSTVNVTFSSALPSANYRVSVSVGNSTGYSDTDHCTTFHVLSKTTTGFQFAHHKCKDATARNVTVNTILDWIAFPDQ